MLPTPSVPAMPSAAAAPPRAVLVIAHPISGGGHSTVLVPALCAALAARSIHAEACFTTGAGDGTARARRAAAEDWDAIVAAGGDGTINEVVNGLPDLSRPVGFLPVGTANVLALELGLPRDPAAAAAVLANGRLREHTVGECNGRRFLLFAGAGLDGAVVERLSQVRTGTLGKHKWLGPILYTLRRWPRFELRAILACGTVLDGCTAVLVTRVRNYGGVVRLLPEIDAAAGQLHVLAFRSRSRTAWALQGLRAFCGRLRTGPDLDHHVTSALRIEGDAPCQIDGDHGGRTPLDIRLLARPLRIYAP